MSSQFQQTGVGPVDQRPLSPQEYALLQRLLSDPFSIPMTFKTWLVSYLETSTISLPKSSVMGLTRAIASSFTSRAGMIVLSGLDVGAVPPGTLRCDGTSYLRTAQPSLFQAIGTRYGAADGAHFNVPNLAGAIAGVDFNIVS